MKRLVYLTWASAQTIVKRYVAPMVVLLFVAYFVPTKLGVSLAGRILTPQERIEKIAAISDEYGPRGYSEKDRIQISGVARTWDGKAISGRSVATVGRSRPAGPEGLFTTLKTSIQGLNSDRVHFSGSVYYGQLTVSVSAAGYAPVFTGPLAAEPGGRIEGIELVLGPGFETRIQAVDESGRPLAGAELVVQYTFPPGGTSRFTTDAQGCVTLEHAVSEKTTLICKADGFPPECVENIVFDPNVTRVVTLRKAQFLTGRVLSEATGHPIEGAEVHALGSTRLNDPSEKHDIRGTADALTDASGRFELTRLHQDRKYMLFVRASGYGCQYLPDVRPGDKDVVVKLGERKIICGRVTGDLSLLPKNTKGESFIEVNNRYDFFDFSGRISPLGRVPVTIRDAVGYFQVDGPCGRIVTLSVGDERVSVRLEQDPLDDVVLELIRPALREVVLRFKAPEGAPPVEGSVEVRYHSERDRSGGSKFVAIEDGDARCEIPVPGSLSYSAGNGFGYDGKGPIGYWFPEVRLIPIAAGPDPYVIEVPVRPAGAIYGRILGPDGNVAENARELLYLMNPEILERGPSRFLGHGIQGGPFGMDYGTQFGSFKVTPLPFGGDYLVTAWEGNRFAASGVIHLDEEHPIVEVNLQLLQGAKVTGRLLDDEGHPVRIPVGLYGLPTGSSLDTIAIGGTEVTPDENGRFVFENVSPGPTGTCGLSVWPRADYQRTLQKIDDLGSPVTIRLQRGLHLRGTVIDDATGWPVPNAMTRAWTAPEGDDYPPGQSPLHLMPEGPTNQRGEFVFSNLSPGRYELMCFGVSLSDGRAAVVATAGQAEPLTLRITIPKGRDLQPQAPQPGQ